MTLITGFFYWRTALKEANKLAERTGRRQRVRRELTARGSVRWTVKEVGS